MDLGAIPTRYQGANLLHGAVHDKNGVVWSDGRGIYLAPVSLYEGQVENQQPTKLGEFDRGVKSIHWSEDLFDGFCYMCVVHDKNISIWKVEGHSPKLSFKQVRKVNIQPIQQGCLWCPERDILCVLCPHQASLYYSHIENKGSHVILQVDSREKICCGCWLPDGSRLVICVGTSLTVYSWSDIDSSVIQYNSVSWTIPGLNGPVSTIAPLTNDQVICAAELPLESLCKQNNTFVLPDLLNNQPTVQEINHLADGDIIRPRQTAPTVKDVLLNLPRNSEADIADSSYLVVVSFHDNIDLEKVSECKVKGILTPDILLYEPDSQLIVVGSNTQTLLQLFDLGEKDLIKSGEICLEKDERPKGICCLPTSAGQGHSSILLLLGKKEASDSAFLSSSNKTVMKSVLKVFSIKKGKAGEPKKPLTHTNSEPLVNNESNVRKQNGTLSVFKNGSHGDINIGQGQTAEKGQAYNNNTARGYISDDFANLKNGQAKSCVNLSTVQRSMGNGQIQNIKVDQEIMKCRSVDNVKQESDRSVTEGPVPPRRPVRKKRSSRGRGDMSEKVAAQRYKQTLGKMAMEYSSSSPDMSPRQSGVGIVPSMTQQNKSDQTQSDVDQTVTSKNVGEVSVEHIEQNTADKEEVNVLNSSNSSEVSNNSKHSSSSKCDNVGEETPRDITLIIGRKDVSNKSKIVELGTEDSKKELEIEKVHFDSQKRNFEKPNLHSSCFEDALFNGKSESYLAESKFEKPVTVKEEEELQSLESGSQLPVRTLAVEEPKYETSLCASKSRSLESLEDIDRLLKKQTKSISNLQEQISDLNRRVNNSSCVLPSRYKSNQTPEIVYVSFLCKDGSEIKKKFLLDNGRLKLEPVKQTFCLETVEIYIDDEPCVTGSNIDGYIPMRFESGTTIHITGKPSLTLV